MVAQRRRAHPYTKVPPRPVAGQVMEGARECALEQPQDPLFHAENPPIQLDLPSLTRTPYAHPSGSSSASESQWQLASDEQSRQWTQGLEQIDYYADPTSYLPSSHAYSNTSTGPGVDSEWGAAAFRYANSAMPTQDGELSGIIALAAHSAHAQMSTWRGEPQLSSTDIPSESSINGPQSQSLLTMAVRPLRGGEMRSADGARSTVIQAIQVGTTRLNVPKCRQNVRLPPTPDIPPAHPRTTSQPLQTDAPQSRPDQLPSTSEIQHTESDILQIAKREIRRLMFTQLAVPQKALQREELIKKALDVAMDMLSIPTGQHPRTSGRRKMAKALVETMAKVRLAFREHARAVLETTYDLLPALMGGDEVDEVAHKSEVVRSLLSNNNFLHDTNPANSTVYYFERRAVVDLIVHVIWGKLRCGHLVKEANMDSIFGLAAAALKVALTEHSTGVYERMPIQSSCFTEAYNDTTLLIQGMIRTDIRNSERYSLLCQKIVERGNTLWPHDDLGSGDENF